RHGRPFPVCESGKQEVRKRRTQEQANKGPCPERSKSRVSARRVRAEGLTSIKLSSGGAADPPFVFSCFPAFLIHPFPASRSSIHDRLTRLQGQGNDDAGRHLQSALRAHRAAVQIDDVLHNRET